MRLLSGELRQGAQESVVAEAVAKAAHAPAAAVRQAAMLCGDLGEVARAALVDGPQALSKYAIQLFRPIEPMLASPADSVSEAIEAFGEAAFELKLDGARIQVHKSGGQVRVFSRALRDVTSAVPEVVEAVASMPATRVDPRWRGAGVATGRNAVAVPGDDAPIWKAAGGRSPSNGVAVDAILLRLSLRRRPSAHRRAATRAIRGAAECRRETSRSRIRSSVTPPRPLSSSTAPLRVGTKASWPNRSTRRMPPAAAEAHG